MIVGGGNSAGQAATWLAHRGHPVTIVIREDDLAANMSRYLVDLMPGSRASWSCATAPSGSSPAATDSNTSSSKT